MATSTPDLGGPDVRGLGQNETYVGQRLLFQGAGEVEVGLTDAVDGEDAKQILKQAVLGSILVGIAATLFGGVVAVVLVGTTESFEVAGGFLVLASLPPWLWLALVLFGPRHQVLSDWHLLLDGRARVADTAHQVVHRALTADRRVPAAVEHGQLRVGPPVPGVRNTVRVAIGKYSVYISVFPFGNDLYLGWTLWRRDIPIVIVLRWFASLFRGDPGYSGIIEMEPIKALRESVHNALRQSVEAVSLAPSAPVAETFGDDTPVGAQPVAAPLVTVRYPVEVFSPNGEPVGHAEPGTTYEVIGEEPDAGTTLRDRNGAVAVVKDRSAIQW